MRRFRFYVDMDAHAEHATSRPARQRPPLRLHWFDIGEPELNDDAESDCRDIQTIVNPQKVQAFASAAELLSAVHGYATALAMAVALEEDGRCVLFDRA